MGSLDELLSIMQGSRQGQRNAPAANVPEESGREAIIRSLGQLFGIKQPSPSLSSGFIDRLIGSGQEEGDWSDEFPKARYSPDIANDMVDRVDYGRGLGAIPKTTIEQYAAVNGDDQGGPTAGNGATQPKTPLNETGQPGRYQAYFSRKDQRMYWVDGETGKVINSWECRDDFVPGKNEEGQDRASLPNGRYEAEAELKDNGTPYGTFYITTGDPRARDIHGGGSGLDNYKAPRQGWVPTLGCLRMQNEDGEELSRLMNGQSGKTPIFVIPDAYPGR